VRADSHHQRTRQDSPPVNNGSGGRLPDVGKVLAEQTGPKASYKLNGQELYVRARIISSAKKQNPAVEGDLEMAWVQPVRPQAGK